MQPCQSSWAVSSCSAAAGLVWLLQAWQDNQQHQGSGVFFGVAAVCVAVGCPPAAVSPRICCRPARSTATCGNSGQRGTPSGQLHRTCSTASRLGRSAIRKRCRRLCSIRARCCLAQSALRKPLDEGGTPTLGPSSGLRPRPHRWGGYELTNTVMRHHGGAAWLWCTAEGAAVGHSTGWCACAWLTLLSQQLWWDRAPCSAVRSLGRQHDVLCSGQAVALCNADVQPASQAALPGAH